MSNVGKNAMMAMFAAYDAAPSDVKAQMLKAVATKDPSPQIMTDEELISSTKAFRSLAADYSLPKTDTNRNLLITLAGEVNCEYCSKCQKYASAVAKCIDGNYHI